KASNAMAVVQRLLGFTAGDAASAGLEKTGLSPAQRGQDVPQLTPTIEKGPSAVAEFSPRIREKVTQLLKYWNNADAWEHDHIWIPVDALP
ncbi:MAG: hypothetical protein Q8K78_04825, partial [Planctomycetaceae bacterium]|nr:hypothetical protein [Planctomycetaceae bacterium]